MWRNCTVCLAGIMALGAVGCVIDGSDNNAAIRVRWDLAYLDNTQANCVDADTLQVSMVATNVETGAKFSSMLSCGAKIGVTDKLPKGFYDVSLSLLDRKGRVVSVVDYQDIEARRSGVVEPSDVAVFPVQAWDLAWNIMKVGPGGKPLASGCEQVGAKSVELTWQLGGEAPESVLFDCRLYQGTSPAIRTGLYQAQVRLLDANGGALSETDFMSRRVGQDGPAQIDVDLSVL